MIQTITICSKILCVVLGLIYLKSSIKKIKQPYLFFVNFSNFKVFNKKISFFATPTIIVLELALSLLLLTTMFQNITLIMGILIQIFYFIVIISNFNKVIDANCNCFSLNLPRHVTVRNLLKNLSLLLIQLMIFVVWIRYLN
ncbi:MauE/DoxX family redox-associated membrane protein [Paenibacillus sp. SI8]|uniref:MauE/DoxX family redox-associated membrane protein n=1 Tax=unclassified Paenibacillus TaxID=185978 RepID=UPI0034651E8A